jgi:hypothetical protein
MIKGKLPYSLLSFQSCFLNLDNPVNLGLCSSFKSCQLRFKDELK